MEAHHCSRRALAIEWNVDSVSPVIHLGEAAGGHLCCAPNHRSLADLDDLLHGIVTLRDKQPLLALATLADVSCRVISMALHVVLVVSLAALAFAQVEACNADVFRVDEVILVSATNLLAVLAAVVAVEL